MAGASKRKSLRFRTKPAAIAHLDLSGGKTFRETLPVLIANESYTGCAVMVISDENFEVNQLVKIKIGNAEALQARIVWCKILDENIKKIGLQFKE